VDLTFKYGSSWDLHTLLEAVASEMSSASKGAVDMKSIVLLFA
jgi:hypothetical protein